MPETRTGLSPEKRSIRKELRRRRRGADALTVSEYNPSRWEPARLELSTWNESNQAYVSSVFAPSAAALYTRPYVPPANLFVKRGADVERHNGIVAELARRLGSLADSINHLDLVAPSDHAPMKPPSHTVFIVHGRDLDLAGAVATFVVNEFGLDHVILQDKPNGGIVTVIEKVEANSNKDFHGSKTHLVAVRQPVKARALLCVEVLAHGVLLVYVKSGYHCRLRHGTSRPMTMGPLVALASRRGRPSCTGQGRGYALDLEPFSGGIDFVLPVTRPKSLAPPEDRLLRSTGAEGSGLHWRPSRHR